jgi:transcriptional regulator with XRE-family HTH domain
MAARIRAAHAYSDLSRQELAAAINLSARQLGRLESGEVMPDNDLRERIAEVCGVPLEFLEDGWPDGQPSSGERLDALEAQYTGVQAELRALRDTDGTLTAGIQRLERALQAIRGTGRRRGRPGADG